MSKNTKKKKKDKNSIYTKEEIEQILDRETSPHNLIKEFVGVDVVKEIKNGSDIELIDKKDFEISVDENIEKVLNENNKSDDNRSEISKKLLPRLTTPRKAKQRRCIVNSIPFN